MLTGESMEVLSDLNTRGSQKWIANHLTVGVHWIAKMLEDLKVAKYGFMVFPTRPGNLIWQKKDQFHIYKQIMWIY